MREPNIIAIKKPAVKLAFLLSLFLK